MLIDSVPWTRSIVFFVLFFIKKKSTFVTSPLFEKERKERKQIYHRVRRLAARSRACRHRSPPAIS